jgi:hypothetical protein
LIKLAEGKPPEPTPKGTANEHHVNFSLGIQGTATKKTVYEFTRVTSIAATFDEVCPVYVKESGGPFTDFYGLEDGKCEIFNNVKPEQMSSREDRMLVLFKLT